MTDPRAVAAEPSAGRYASPYDGRLWCPFVLTHQPMERLMLVNIADDPRCPGIEPQLFDDPVHGTGAAVIVYRRDRTVDVYHQPGLRLDPASFAIGAGLRTMAERPLSDLRFEIGPDGVDLEVHLVDADGMRIDAQVREHRRGAMTPVALLAPVGGDIDRPAYLPLFFLYGFTLVPRAGTEIILQIDGQARAPVPFPFPLGLRRYWFLRYGVEPFICTLNPVHDGPLDPIAAPATGSLQHEGTRYDLVERDGHPEVAAMTLAAGDRSAQLSFDPPFPDVTALRDGLSMEGRFAVKASGRAGSLAGTWTAVRTGPRTDLALRPAGGWRTAERSLALRFVFGLRPFRRWVDTYRWSASMEPISAGMAMTSSWTRVPPR